MAEPSTVAEIEADLAATVPARASAKRTLATIAFGVLALACIVYALVSRWGDVRENIDQLSWTHLTVAMALVLASLVASMLAWRALLTDLGNELTVPASARIVFTGQLGKYIPGSLWTVVAQAQLARRHGVSTARAASAALLHNLLSLGVSLVLGAATLPFLLEDDLPSWIAWVALASPLGLLLLSPPVLNRFFATVSRLSGRPRPDVPITWRGMAAAVGWTTCGWVLLSAHAAVLGHALGGRGGEFVVAASGGYALAWAIGFLAVLAPAGAGARELVLVVALSGRLPGGEAAALTLAVVSRLLTLVADLVVAAAALAMRPARPGVAAVGPR